MIPTRSITLHVYFPLVEELDEAVKKSLRFGVKLSSVAKSRWINEAIAQKLDRPPPAETAEVMSVATGRRLLCQFLVAVPYEVVEKMDEAVRASGRSRNKWVNAAIRSALGMEEDKLPQEGLGVRIQMGVFIGNARRIDERVKMEGTTRTAWINAAIRERVERDKDLPPAVAPVTRAIPKVSTPAQMEAAERKAKIEAIRAQRLAEAAKEAEDEEIDFWG